MAENALDRSRYAGRLILLHWLIAALVFLIWPLGLMIGFVKDEVKPSFYLLHESFGFLVLWLMLLRVGVRLAHSAPAKEGSVTMQRVAGLVHGLLYLLLIVMPVSGFLASNAYGFPLHWFGLVTVWSPIGKVPDLAGPLLSLHTACAWMLLVLVALHLAATIYHQAVRRDGTLNRMI
ncbi:cytochrome b [Rhizobium sp. YIM 134829]|uniref:cytochrome b n=1 Tax=Rhizobium sp. YIM 134829 TaxID=3390453 RepID=UPI003979C926